MPEHAPHMPHGEIEEVFPDVYFVTGTTRPTFEGVTFQFSRNMTIVRARGRLTLVNTVRLDDAGLARLESLGEIANVVKLGAFHGIDDAFYVSRYGAKQWALVGDAGFDGQATDVELRPGDAVPFLGCELFVYETSARPEGLLLIDREGGIVVSCDSLQNWVETDRFFSEESCALMQQFGFIRPANIGPGWRRGCDPKASDFIRLMELRFRHLLPAHGRPLLEHAHEELSATFRREFEL